MEVGRRVMLGRSLGIRRRVRERGMRLVLEDN